MPVDPTHLPSFTTDRLRVCANGVCFLQDAILEDAGDHEPG